MKKHMVFALMAICLTVWVPADLLRAEEEASAPKKSAEAIDILKKAEEAAHKVHSARFEASMQPTGVFVNFVGAAEGRSYMEGWDEEIQRPRKFWTHMKTSKPGSEAMTELTGGGDGETYFVIDHAAKKAYEDLDPAVQGSNAQSLVVLGFGNLVSDDPYGRDLGAVSLEVVGTEEVAGVECHQVKVGYDPSDQSGEVYSIWSIGKTDFLPRKRLRHFSFGTQGEGGMEILLSKMEVNPKVEPSLFKLKLPEGYEQIDDFAP